MTVFKGTVQTAFVFTTVIIRTHVVIFFPGLGTRKSRVSFDQLVRLYCTVVMILVIYAISLLARELRVICVALVAYSLYESTSDFILFSSLIFSLPQSCHFFLFNPNVVCELSQFFFWNNMETKNNLYYSMCPCWNFRFIFI